MIQGNRLQLEQTILGACILENAYPIIADLLTHKNFSIESANEGFLIDHQVIFKVLEKYYPVKPIDMRTVAFELKNMNGYPLYIAQLCTSVSSAANLRFYALCLLELSIRNSFIDVLQNLFSSGRLGTGTMQAIQEIIDEALDHDNDIFSVIENSIRYLKSPSVYDPELTVVLDQFSAMIDQRIAKVKHQSHIDCLVNNLSNLNRLSPDPQTKLVIDQLTDILKMIIGNGKVQPELAKQIFSLQVRS